MVALSHLWLPMLLSAVIVFVASAVMHTVLKYHNSDFHGLPNEDEVRAAIRKGGAGPGLYLMPYCPDMKEAQSPPMVQKYTEGPVGMLVLRAPGVIRMGGQLVQWFIYTLVISLFAAYVAAHTVQAGTSYLEVFRVVGTVAFLGYAGSEASASIWMARPWPATCKAIFDGLVYGLLTAGTFGWLWPR